MMPRYILKCDRDTDLYVEWSTVVDNVTRVGTREQCIHDGIEAERLARADKTGTSVVRFWTEGDGYHEGSFEDEHLLVRNCQTIDDHGGMLLPRDRLLDYARLVYANDMAGAEVLLELGVVEEDG